MNNMMETIDLKVNNRYELHVKLPSGETYMCIAQLRGVTIEGLGRADDSIDAEFIIIPVNVPQGKNKF